MAPAYSEKVLEHFRNPRNVGELENPDGIGREGNPVCGDLMEIHIIVEDDRIKDIRFKTFGCGSAIATSSMVTELAKGKTLDEAMEMSRKSSTDCPHRRCTARIWRPTRSTRRSRTTGRSSRRERPGRRIARHRDWQ